MRFRKNLDPRKSLQGRLIAHFFLVSLATVLLIVLVANYSARRALEQSIYARLESVTMVKEASLTRWQAERKADVVLLTRIPEVRNSGTILLDPATESGSDVYQAAYAALDQVLRDVLRRRVDLNELFLMSPDDGRILYSTNSSRLGERVSAPYFEAGLQNVYLQSVDDDPQAPRMYMVIATPLRAVNGDVKGVLAAKVDPTHMEQIVLDQTGLGGESITYLVDTNRHLVQVIDPYLHRALQKEKVTSDGIEAVLAGQDGRAQYTNYQNIPVLGAYRWLDEMQFGLVAELPVGVAYAPVQRLTTIILVTGLVGIAIMAGLMIPFSRSISRPIVDLTQTAVRVTEGDLVATAAVQTQDEIGVLARTFNQMTEQLRRLYISLEAQVNTRTAELADRVQQLNLINQVGRSAISHLELTELLTEVVKLIRQSFNFYAVGILLVDRERGEVYLSAADTVEDMPIAPGAFAIKIESQSIITQVVKTGRPLVANDVAQNSYYLPADRLPRVRSEIGLPLKVGDEVIGVLEIQHSEMHAFSPEDVQVLQTLSDQIAATIRNAQLFQAAEGARLEAEEANFLKSQFLANMSHELRTPLNAIINFAYLMSLGVDGPLTAEQQDMLNRIGDSGRHLLGLINDILDLAKIESGRIDLFLEKVYLPEVIHGVMSTAVGLTRGKSITLHTAVADDLPLVQADRNRVRQVLLNLVSNAAKFTDFGDITVRAASDGEQWVTVSVTDTGIGIRPDDIPRAFSEFVQLDGHMARRTGGTGLGLPIAKKFIEMHGGQIWVESEPGQGSTFYFTLPQVETGPTPPDTQHITKEIPPLVWH
ncbi:MAG TPA: ATP-binding protein [Chloroflexota bacterium]|nr:ATP-binding protein [Chloroflexota bacterium]